MKVVAQNRTVDVTTQNHYVPRWYQRRFHLSPQGDRKLFYLDLIPDRIRRSDGGYYYSKELQRLGVPSCFKEEHLYSLFAGGKESDILERRLFGPVDRDGERAVAFFSKYEFNASSSKAFRDLLTFIGAQKFRTPKGLAFLREVSRASANQEVLPMLQELLNLYSTIWLEGVWEVVECRDSVTKFIVSDHPVTTYNKDLFPGVCPYPKDAEVECVGTHTIYPLDPQALFGDHEPRVRQKPLGEPKSAAIESSLFCGHCHRSPQSPDWKTDPRSRCLGNQFHPEITGEALLGFAGQGMALSRETNANHRLEQVGIKILLVAGSEKVRLLNLYPLGRRGALWGPRRIWESAFKRPYVRAQATSGVGGLSQVPTGLGLDVRPT